MNMISRRSFFTESVAAGAFAVAADSTSETQASGMKWKITAVSCSPRQGRATATSLKVCLDAAAKVDERLDTELIELAELSIPGEPAAGITLPPGTKDDFPALVPRLSDPRIAAIIIGTPVYFSNMSYLCKAFLDRCMALWSKRAFKDKVGAVIAVGSNRNGGQEATIQSVQATLFCHEMNLVGTGRPNARFGAAVVSGGLKDVTEDEFGMEAVRSLGRRVAEAVLATRD